MVQRNVVFELCERLDSSLEWATIRPDDIEVTMDIANKLDQALASRDTFPATPQNSPAGDLARLLWIKNHPSKSGYKFVLDQLQAPFPIARATAADTLNELLDSTDGFSADRRAFSHARMVLARQSRAETSRLVAHRLEKATKSLTKVQSRQRRRPVSPIRRNPYVAGMPVRGDTRFFGRTEIINQIRASLSKPGVSSVILYGARRTGKTSLLLKIKDGALGDSFVPVYVDMQAMGGGKASKLLGYLVAKISTALWEEKKIAPEQLPTTTEEPDFAFATRYLETALEILRPASLVIMLDEYEVLKRYLEDAGFGGQFQSLLENNPGIFCIFAGSQKVEALQEKGFLFLLDVSQYIKISFLSEEETEKLITGPTQGILEYDQQTISRIYRLTGGHPFFTQLLCQGLFDFVDQTGQVTIEHLKKSVAEFLLNPSPHLVLSWKMLSIDQEIVGASIADLEADNEWVSPDQIVRYLRKEKYPVRLRQGEVREGLARLREIDWVEKEPQKQRYRFAMEIVRLWVAEYRSIWEILAEQRKAVFAQTAGGLRQLLAWIVDIALVSIVVMGISTALYLVLGSWLQVVDGPLLTINVLLNLTLIAVYFLVSLTGGRATLGMLTLKLRPLNRNGTMPGPSHSIWLGSLLTLRAYLWVFALPMLTFWFSWDIGKHIPWLFLVAGVEALDLMLTFGGRSRRGLFHRLAATIAVRKVPERRR